jgi:hypothetical protein
LKYSLLGSESHNISVIVSICIICVRFRIRGLGRKDWNPPLW